MKQRVTIILMAIIVLLSFTMASCGEKKEPVENASQSQNEQTDAPDTQKPESLPWENGGEQPKDYTWEAYQALTDQQKAAFRQSFESDGEFQEWWDAAQGNEGMLPWENGGKQPSEYTWKEFEALPPAQQMDFQKSFDSIERFEAWMQEAQLDSIDKPWENGGKQPKDYTWEEFMALEPGQQIEFQYSFGSIEAFDKWLTANEPK